MHLANLCTALDSMQMRHSLEHSVLYTTILNQDFLHPSGSAL